MQVNLHANGLSKTAVVHRMVAEAFIPRGDDPTLQVDHIDNNKLNNHASNLQWLTPSQNVAKTFKQGRLGSRKGKIMGKNMTFYIKKENAARLEAYDGSKGGLVNELLEAHFNGSPAETTHPPKNTEVETFEPAINGLIKRTRRDVLAEITQIDNELKSTVNQDPDYWADMQERKQLLWDEYNGMEDV